MLSDREALELVNRSDFVWHQRFHLSENVVTPGVNDLDWLWDQVGIPHSLQGASVLDIGTTNGGAAFIAERQGAERVVAVDVVGPDHFGFDDLRKALKSQVEFVRASVYELPELLSERFDIVLFLGVLYHLRHPLLAIDAVRRLTSGTVYVESAVSGSVDAPPATVFYRLDELNGDSSNWFSPNVACLVAWMESCGFVTDRVRYWPVEHPGRASLRARPANGEPEFVRVSREAPLTVRTSV